MALMNVRVRWIAILIVRRLGPALMVGSLYGPLM